MRHFAALLAVLALNTPVLAHTAVTSLTPAAYASVSAPKAVQLTLSEPVDLHFATFKVYPLAAGGDRPTLDRAAADLMKSKIGLKNDEPQQADTAPKLTGMAARLSLPLKAGLKPGNYALIWRILSDDGHIVTGQSVFSIR